MKEGIRGKLSVIVPAYNVEKYIDRCVESLEKQGDVLQKIVIVNDGSIDETFAHVDVLMKKYCNIVVINQSNQGLFRARLNGLEKVETEWVTFCDSDDYIDEFFYEKVFKWVEEKTPDIIEFGIRKVSINSIKYEFLPEFRIVNGSEGIRRIIEKDNSSCSNCNKIYRTSLFRRVTFDEKIRCYEEDKYINIKVMCEADKVMYIPEIGYNYDTRENSITTKKMTPKYYAILDSNRLVYEYIKKKKRELCQTVGYDYCAHLAFCYIFSSEIEQDIDKRKQRREQFKEEYKRIYKEAMLDDFRPRKETKKRYFMMRLFKFSPFMAAVIGNLSK